MYFMRILLVTLLSSLRGLNAKLRPGKTNYGIGKDYCNWETFNATCGQSEVVLMESAHYGRMTLGRCITTDVYIGCVQDVLLTTDFRCSGRHHCAITVPDPALEKLTPCPSDQIGYLKANYKCVPVANGEEVGVCRSPIVIEGQTGYIANSITEFFNYGSKTCPWVIQVEPGQRINITLLDFTFSDQSKANDKSRNTDIFCNVYAVIGGGSNGRERETAICGGMRREQPVFLSEGNSVEVKVVGFSTPEKQIYFLLKYEAVGCPDPIPPRDAWFTRDGEKATVKCNNSAQTWHLVCKENNWFGDLRNCTDGYGYHDGKGGSGKWAPYGLLAAVIIGVVLGVCLGLCLLGIVLVCRRRQLGGRRFMRGGSERADMYATYEQEGQAKIVRPTGEHGYTHVWELRSQEKTTTDPRAGDPNIQKLSMYHDRAQQMKSMQQNPQSSKDHIYESPKFERSGRIQEGGMGTFYHEFGHGAHEAHLKRPVSKFEDHEATSEDTEDELESCDLRFSKGKGYRPVPPGIPLVGMAELAAAKRLSGHHESFK